MIFSISIAVDYDKFIKGRTHKYGIKRLQKGVLFGCTDLRDKTNTVKYAKKEKAFGSEGGITSD